MHKKVIFFEKTLAGFRKMPTFATAIERESNYTNIHLGALVQLVRIHACHAWGHGFESRTHRSRKLWFYQESELFCIIFVSEIYFS